MDYSFLKIAQYIILNIAFLTLLFCLAFIFPKLKLIPNTM